METCLKKIAGLFNQNGVCWALGASMLLHYKGLAAQPQDIDLMVAPEDASLADRLLCSLGQKQPPSPHAAYGTRHFYEYKIDGIDIDLMAGFAIFHSTGSYKYRLDKTQFEYMTLDGVSIPLCPLEDWLVLYALMPNRHAKVEAVRQYLAKNGARAEVVRTRLQEPLPPEVKALLLPFVGN